MKKNILLCGLGSIGNKHARLLKENFDFNLFALRSYKGQQKNELEIQEFTSWEQLDDYRFDIAFITNPTNLHIEYALECAKRKMHLFIEKPIDNKLDGLDELLGIIKENKLTAFVGYPLRFNPVIQFIKKYIEDKKILHVRMICESYLPHWRPTQNHLKNYSTSKEQGGGVILDLSHEIDLASYLFGGIKSIKGRYSKVSELTIDSEDFADLLLQHNHTFTNIHLNYFSLETQRIIEIKLKEEYLNVDLINNKIFFFNRNSNVEKLFNSPRDEMFLNQLNYFIENIQNTDLDNNLLQASELFRKIIKFKESI